MYLVLPGQRALADRDVPAQKRNGGSVALDSAPGLLWSPTPPSTPTWCLDRGDNIHKMLSASWTGPSTPTACAMWGSGPIIAMDGSLVIMLCMLWILHSQAPVFLRQERVNSDWDVQCPDTRKSVSGSCLLIPCSFNYPRDVQPVKGIVPIWFKNYGANRMLVYHPTGAIDGTFQGRADFLGDVTQKNCTIVINDVKTQDAGAYKFRFEITGVNNWLGKNEVQADVTDEPLSPEVMVPPRIAEGALVTFQCSTPYFCPDGSVNLNWQDYVTERSVLSSYLQLDSSQVLMQHNLTTSFTWLEDKKTISCVLSVGNKKAVRQVPLNIIHPPKDVTVSISHSGGNIKEGDSMTLTCQVNSSNPAVQNYTWYKNDVRISGERFIYFHSVSRNDFGEYRCEVQNGIGTETSDTLHLIVFSARTLVAPSSEVKEGELVTLTCDVPGGRPEEIQYSWFKNNVWIQEEYTRSLVFHEVLKTDAGYYYCKVQNDKGGDSSPPVTLNVLYPPGIPVITSFLETQEGKLVIIHCTVDSNPFSELMFYRDGVPITSNQRLRVISAPNSLKLQIQNVLLSDEGTYSCLARNSLRNSTSSLHFAVETARVIITPSAEIEEGKEATLTCLSTRNSQKVLTYTWYKNGMWLKEDSEGNTLSFKQLSRLNAGSYYCRVQNSNGISSSPQSMLHVLFPPSDVSLTSFVATQSGISAIIQCSVASDPRSEIFIYRTERLMASSATGSTDKRYAVSASRNALKLEIPDVLLEDEGTYTCFANNTYGNAMSSLDFTAETTKIIASPSLEVVEGLPVNLTCVVRSSAEEDAYSYTWYKNNAPYSEGQEGFLKFPQVASTDSGSYYCKVWNGEKSKESASVSLTVLYPPRHIQLKSFLDTEESRVASIRCTVDSYSPAQIHLYFENQLVASNMNRTTSNQRYIASFSHNELRLEIKDVKLGDGGKYTCAATNDMGSASQSTYFKVQTARILVSPSVEVLEGETVTLTCDVTKTQLEGVTYTWYKNSKMLLETAENTLVFDRIQAGDSGYYYCKAHDTQESSRSPSVSLHVSYAPREPFMSSFWETQSGLIGIIQCSVDSDPPASLTLYRQNIMVGKSDSDKSTSQRMTITSLQNSLKLEIRDVVLEDEGVYMCTANNSIGYSTSSINFTAQTTRILISPSPVVQEGQSVNLTCSVATDTPQGAKYTWYKNGHWYKEDTEGSFMLKSTSREDQGSYFCTMHNQHGAKSSPSVVLNILHAPDNVYIKSFLEVQNGKVAIIQCGAESNPPPEMSLYKDEKLLASSAAGGASGKRMYSYFSSNSLTLQITDILMADGGQYTFVANNTFGSKQVSTVFSVEGARVLMSPPTDLQEGRSVTLTCDVLDSSLIVTGYTWYKNNKWLQDGSMASLVVNRVDPGDAGSYLCTAHMREGSVTSSSVILRVLYPPRNLSLVSFLETQERRLGVVMCRVDSVPPSHLSLYRGTEEVISTALHGSHGKLSSSHNSLKLEISEIVEEDQDLYICRANNSLGSSETSIQFAVQTARVVVFPSSELREGASANLTCHVPRTARRNGNYTWYRNNNWLTDRAGASLVLPNVSASDAGSYHCVAEHSGECRISSLIGITVLYGPRKLVMTSFLETHGRRRGIIVCSADSVPPSVISLYSRDVLLASTVLTQADQGQKFWSSSSYNYLRLEIRDVGAEDSGSYVCTANNSLGATKSTITFSITNWEALLYKVMACIAIICIIILMGAIAVILYRIKSKEKYKIQTEMDSFEMEKGTAEDQS
ncbi:sialoadhesin [Spea bombifrons]|uniref:sialoadhesin n=1 Tax=Spea bombifrons TaxID=233779 RepID=UPI00234991EF|nr:sialoadhesin [Spea bombifrons]